MLYVNDPTYASKFETTLFADDTNLHLSHNDIDSLQTQAEHETIKINNWVNVNKLTINYKKSYFMIVGNKIAVVSSFKLSINYNLIEETDNVKYLGVHLDQGFLEQRDAKLRFFRFLFWTIVGLLLLVQ